MSRDSKDEIAKAMNNDNPDEAAKVCCYSIVTAKPFYMLGKLTI